MIMVKAILLFSGGLDSMITSQILSKQKIKVIPVCFYSYFFDCQRAKKSAEILGLKLKTIDFSEEHLKIIKSPKYGRGKGLNPCIDCHLLMIKEAKKLLKKTNSDFIATGDVLGQRPFSQNLKALKIIEEKSGLGGLILRPLSAQLLPATFPEKRGWVKREALFGIKGKSRTPQLLLAKEFDIKEFPTPSGGCILTNLEYSEKLKELFKMVPDCDGNDCQLLRKGRVFWKKDDYNNVLIVVARNEKDCLELKKMKKETDVLLEPQNFSGPVVLVRGFFKKANKKIIQDAKELLLQYSKVNIKPPLFNIK